MPLRITVAAFEALSGLWKPEDLSLLTSLYGKIRSMHIKIDILEAISSLGNQDNNSIDFLKEQVQLNKILSPYAELYLHANNPEKLAKYITNTQNINLFFRGLECLRQSDSQAYLDMVIKSAIPAKKRVDSFLRVHEVTSEDEEEHSVPETPGSSTHTKSPRISRTVYTFKEEQSENNRIHNIRRLFTLQGNRYAYLHMEYLDGEPYSHCTIQFTSNFKDWLNPLPYTIKSSLSGQFILALDKHRILLSIMQEKPDANIYNQRPFFRIIDENDKIQPGFYPLKEEITFSEQDLFRFGRKYYLVGFPEPGMESLGWDLELNKNVFIYSSTDMKV